MLAVRVYYAFPLDEPLQAHTIGFEHESLYAVWKWVRGLPVYADPFAPPYAVSYFNWAFYAVYGLVVSAVLGMAGLGMDWLPTVARGVTLVLSVTGAVAFYRLLGLAEEDHRIERSGFTLLVFAGPLVGFWTMTARPDMGALAFEALALYAFFTLDKRSTLAAVLAAAGLAYLAWAFKQSNVGIAGALGFYLLIERRWRDLFLFSGVLIGLWGITLAAGSPLYRDTVLLINVDVAFTIDLLISTTKHAAALTTPATFVFLGLVLGALASARVRKGLLSQTMVRVALGGILTWLFLQLPASANNGAGPNYHIPVVLYLSLAGYGALRFWRSDERPPLLNTVHMVGWVFLLPVIGIVYAGSPGPKLAANHDDLMRLKACLKNESPPMFIYGGFSTLPLPWMHPGEESFVPAFHYWGSRRAGRPFKEGGIGGMIKKRAFATLVLTENFKGTFDGAPLGDYVLASNDCPGYNVFRRPSMGGRAGSP